MRKIIVTSNMLYEFASHWPCANFPEGHGVSFEFDRGNNLVDVEWFNSWSGKTVSEPEGIDQHALLAVSNDAREGKIGSGPA